MPVTGASGGSAASLRDVARLAGVSHQTVSRVINGYPSIRESTRTRVLAAIDELNYRPNSLARALASGRSRRIGVLIESTSHYGPMNMLRGVEAAARVADYTAMAYTVRRAYPNDFQHGIEYLLGHDIEALCILAPRQSSLEGLRDFTLPRATVVIGSSQPDVDKIAGAGAIISVAVDLYAGGVAAAEHLVEKGHSVIGHISGPLDWVDARQRRQAWQDTLTVRGLPVPEPILGDWSADSGYRAAEQVMRIPDLSAVFAANDQMALGLIHGLSEHGVRVPDDISVVGFDDIPECRHFLPPLTTVRQNFALLGHVSVAATLHLLGEAPQPDRLTVAPTLVTRSSVRDLNAS